VVPQHRFARVVQLVLAHRRLHRHHVAGISHYTLGEPKFEPDECRQRDLTYEKSISVKVRVVNKETGELKESEVYLGELPLHESWNLHHQRCRVSVAQLSQPLWRHFKEEIAYSGRRLLQMQIIPQ